MLANSTCMAGKFSQEIEVKGHLVDSLILSKIFNIVIDVGGEFEVLEMDIGKKKHDESYARLQVLGKNKAQLDKILELTYREGATSKHQTSVKLKPAILHSFHHVSFSQYPFLKLQTLPQHL